MDVKATEILQEGGIYTWSFPNHKWDPARPPVRHREINGGAQFA